jgi:hypothetical protein
MMVTLRDKEFRAGKSLGLSARLSQKIKVLFASIFPHPSAITFTEFRNHAVTFPALKHLSSCYVCKLVYIHAFRDAIAVAEFQSMGSNLTDSNGQFLSMLICYLQFDTSSQ